MILSHVSFINCPKTSLGVLGKKWTILIIRDIGFLKIEG
jgi:DNA-binding HxlR family transcriptional regulator